MVTQAKNLNSFVKNGNYFTNNEIILFFFNDSYNNIDSKYFIMQLL